LAKASLSKKSQLVENAKICLEDAIDAANEDYFEVDVPMKK
jgi:hypothetical protein